MELRGCILRDVGVLIQRDGEPGDVPFSCRLGKIMVRRGLFSCFHSFHHEDNQMTEQDGVCLL